MNRSNVDRPGKATATWITLLAILLTICLFLTYIILPLNRTALNAEFYVSSLTDSQVYSRLPELITGSITSSIQVTGDSSISGQLLAVLTQDQVNALVTATIPPGWAETQANALIRAVMDFVNLESNGISVVIDLQPIKQNLLGPTGQQAFYALLANPPACTPEQLSLILTALQNGQTGFTLCNPPVEDASMMDFLIQPVIAGFNNAIPAAITIPSAAQAAALTALMDSKPFHTYDWIRQLMTMIPWICLGLALLISILARRFWRLWMTGLGLPLVFSGMAAALPAAWLYMNNALDFKPYLIMTGMQIPSMIADILNSLGQELLQSLGWSMLIWSLGALMAGLILVALRFVIGEKRKAPISSG